VAAALQAVALHHLWATARVNSFPRTRSTSPSHTLPSVRPPSSEPLDAAAAAAGHCRAPLRQLLRPNSAHLQALGEHVVVPHRFPGREHGRLAGIRPAPPPPHAEALNANPLVFLGCFL
jgi:hypothetical protein